MDLYAYINVPDNCSSKEIETAYRKKARNVHPDRNDNSDEATEEFKFLQQAYEILKVERTEYDAYRIAQIKEQQNKEEMLQQQKRADEQRAEEETIQKKQFKYAGDDLIPLYPSRFRLINNYVIVKQTNNTNNAIIHNIETAGDFTNWISIPLLTRPVPQLHYILNGSEMLTLQIIRPADRQRFIMPHLERYYEKIANDTMLFPPQRLEAARRVQAIQNEIRLHYAYYRGTPNFH